MLIAVMSDSHDNKNNLRSAISIINGRKCKTLIHCGDFTSPMILYEFKNFEGKVYGVFGNNDYDMDGMKETAKEAGNIEFLGFEAELGLDGKMIALSHYPVIARGLAMSGHYRAVFYGHTHIFNIEECELTFLINPGEIAEEKGTSSFIFYKLSSGKVEKVIVN